MKKLDLIIAVSAAIIGMYYMSSLAMSYHQAMQCYFDVKHSQAYSLLMGK